MANETSVLSKMVIKSPSGKRNKIIETVTFILCTIDLTAPFFSQHALLTHNPRNWFIWSLNFSSVLHTCKSVFRLTFDKMHQQK